MTRAQAYKWMQAKLGLSKQQAHIAMFSDYRCDQLIQACYEARKNNEAIKRKEAKHNGKRVQANPAAAETG